MLDKGVQSEDILYFNLFASKQIVYQSVCLFVAFVVCPVGQRDVSGEKGNVVVDAGKVVAEVVEVSLNVNSFSFRLNAKLFVLLSLFLCSFRTLGGVRGSRVINFKGSMLCF